MSLCHHVRLAVTDQQDAEDWVKTKSALLDIAIHPVLSEKLRHIIKVANLWTPIAWTMDIPHIILKIIHISIL